MKILIRDLMQECGNVPELLRSPALADDITVNPIENIELPNSGWVRINCVGIGYTDATQVTLTFDSDVRVINITEEAPIQNGLYLIDEILQSSGILLDISHNGTYIGRVGFGEYRQLNTALSKEPGFYGTAESITTLSGQVIPGAGGYYGRTQDLDVRYKIKEETYNDIYNAYSYIMKEYPYFLLFDDEQHKLPSTLLRFYAKTSKPISKLQSSTYKFLYSYKFNFIESF